MSLRDIEIRREYQTLVDNVAKEFLVPALSNAKIYKRAVGFFSSSALVSISKGLEKIVENDGRIFLIASPKLSEEDIDAIRTGYEARDKVLKRAIKRELVDPINEYQVSQLNLLANLIADGYLDIRVAITESSSNLGMYHVKMGIIEDYEGNKIAFTGSMNDSNNSFFANYETIDVYKSWDSASDFARINDKEDDFDKVWCNVKDKVATLEFKDITEEFIDKYKREKLDYKEFINRKSKESEKEYTFFHTPENVKFYDYQKDAINTWVKNQCCGIFDMATGSGKTYTALGALSTLSKMLDEKLAVVIVVPYQHLVEQWKEDIQNFGVNPIVAYSYPGQNWRTEFKDSVNAYNVGAIDHFCIITTNATFSTSDFQNILIKFRKNYCFVVDEAHNIGTQQQLELLPKKARFRIALSATIERYGDEEGTVSLRKYFGKTCISFTLAEAIDRKFLTSYFYYPVIVHLNEDELERYKEITDKINSIVIKNGNDDNEIKKKLYIKRARIIAGCREKVDRLIEVMDPYKNDNYILVYCGATKYDINGISDDDDVKVIDEVNRRLYYDLGMKVRKFTSTENKEERREIKQMFSTGSELQVITAIKCLDEGVNIPAIKTAFILASSTNPKEYIQRKGRVLRKSNNKKFSLIYDFITLPRSLETVKYCSHKELGYDISLLNKEFTRMRDFAETSNNPADVYKLIDKINEVYHQYIND